MNMVQRLQRWEKLTALHGFIFCGTLLFGLGSMKIFGRPRLRHTRSAMTPAETVDRVGPGGTS